MALNEYHTNEAQDGIMNERWTRRDEEIQS